MKRDCNRAKNLVAVFVPFIPFCETLCFNWLPFDRFLIGHKMVTTEKHHYL